MKVKQSTSKMELVIDLKEDLGLKRPSKDLSEEVGYAIIDAIVDRTRYKKRSVRGHKFKEYSKKYAEFKGVSRGNVDLTLSGDMLDSLMVKKATSRTVVISFDDENQIPKAYNHNVGDTLPKREFFGVNKKELKQFSKLFKAQEKKEKIQKESLKVGGSEEINIEELATFIVEGIKFG